MPAHSFDKANASVCHSKCPRRSLLHCVARCTFYQYSEAMNTALLIPGHLCLGPSSLGYQLRWIPSISQLARRVETHSSGWEWAWETDPAQRVALEARWSWFTCPQGMQISWKVWTITCTRIFGASKKYSKKRFNSEGKWGIGHPGSLVHGQWGGLQGPGFSPGK